MISRIAPLILVIWPFAALFADAPMGYYASAEGRSGGSLKAALHAIIDGHVRIPYNTSNASTTPDTMDAMEILDVDPANSTNVILFYSGRSEPKVNWPAWNREHVWPRSKGIGTSGADNEDLHNLRPADASVNSSRSDDIFDDSEKGVRR